MFGPPASRIDQHQRQRRIVQKHLMHELILILPAKVPQPHIPPLPFRRLGRGRAWSAADLLDRITFTLMGSALTIYWSLPTEALEERLGVPELSAGAEMLFISGILLVSGAVLVIMYNTDLLLRLILMIMGRSPRFAPVLRMSIAYPLSSRFRTGMTIAISSPGTAAPTSLQCQTRPEKRS